MEASSLKSALTFIRNEDSEPSASLWRTIWRLNTPQRMRFFLWLTAHDRLMTNAHRVKRGLATDPKCKSCLQEDEDTLHILRDCRFAREIWSKLIPAGERESFFTTSLYSWLRNNLEKPACPTWPILFTTVVWWLWKWRNICCFKDPDFKPVNPLIVIHKKTKEITAAFNKENLFSANPTGGSITKSLIQWIPPPEGWFKLNVDDVSKGNPGTACAGGLLQGQYGNWIKGFALSIGICTSVKAELTALLQGLKLARNQGVTKLIVHTDSQVVFNKLKGPPPKNRAYFYLVKTMQGSPGQP